MRHGMPVAHLESEEEYFHRLDAELIEELRKRAAAEEERWRMAETSHIENPRSLTELEKLGFSHTTVTLLDLVPLVELAWIDGSVSNVERNSILALASGRGVEKDSPAHQQLIAWLDHRPSQAFFEGTWHALVAFFDSLPADERAFRKNALIRRCKEFASATCARLVWASHIRAAKRKLLHEIVLRLNGPGGPARAA